MSETQDFTSEELSIAETTVMERYGHAVPIELADVEIRLHPDDRELVERPAIYWEMGDCHFVICKVGKNRFRSQFFYRGHQQFGTGREEYDDLHHCVTTLLQVQADHAAQLAAEVEQEQS